jgi:hypothetical protein
VIVSHRHKFVFVKTHKTAGSSLEVALARECGDDDVVSHMEDNIASGIPRNYGPTSRLGPAYNRHKLLRKIVHRHSPLLGAYYYEHMPAWRIRELLGEARWAEYFCFCFERNPWDKVVSYYLWKKHGQGRAMLPFADYLERKAHRLPMDSALYCDDKGRWSIVCLSSVNCRRLSPSSASVWGLSCRSRCRGKKPGLPLSVSPTANTTMRAVAPGWRHCSRERLN